jgi:ABC-type phosphate/phosphonate transport system substrate-binding protein
MNNKIKIAVLAVACVCFLGAANPARAKTYNFMIPVVKGLSVKAVPKMMDDFTKVISKKLGIDLQMTELPYYKGTKAAQGILKSVKSGKTDFTYIGAMEYLDNKSAIDAEMIPFFTLTMMKKKYSVACAYVKKDSTYKNMKDLRGKRWGGTETVPVRVLMYKDGVNEPMSKFFGSMSFVDDANVTKPLDKLLNNQLDVYVTMSYIVDMMKAANKDYATKLRELSCLEYEHNWIFFYKKGTPPDIVNGLKNSMLNVHKDQAFAQFRFILTAIQGNFVDFDPKDLDNTKKIYKFAKENGWFDEEKAFVSKTVK